MLRKRRRYSLAFNAPAAGKLVLSWYVATQGKPVLVASGRRAFSAASRATVAIKLTRAGIRTLRHRPRVKLRATGHFRPFGQREVRASRTFTLTR